MKFTDNTEKDWISTTIQQLTTQTPKDTLEPKPVESTTEKLITSSKYIIFFIKAIMYYCHILFQNCNCNILKYFFSSY